MTLTTTEPKAKRAPDRTVCGGCPATWTGLSRCHCSGCHVTLSSLSLFDQHRTGGRCTSPEDMTVGGEPLRLVDGIWRSPEMSDEDRAARFGGTP